MSDDAPPVRVVIRTALGEILVELAPAEAPLSVGSFLAHVDAGLFDGTSFYRSSRPDNEVAPHAPAQLIQGGIGFNGGSPLPGVAHETGLDPRAGTIGLARDEPGTAASEFFINVADNPEMRPGGARGDGLGVAIFGRVITGMDVVHAIHGRPCGISDPDIIEIAWPQMISDPVRIETIVRV